MPADVVNAYPTRGEDDLPTFLIVGVPRAGTTWIARALGEHPDFFMARNKEVRFFNLNFDRGLDWYKRHFTAASEDHRGEATPHYLYDRLAVERMAHVLPDAKLVVSLRHPVDRAYSHLWLKRELTGDTRPMPSSVAGWRHALSRLLEEGQYVRYLNRLVQSYPRESVYVVVFEEFVADPVRHFNELCSFLGADEGFVPRVLNTCVNEHVRFRSLWLRNLTHAWPKPIRDAIGRLNAVKESYPRLDPEIHRQLSLDFGTWNARLAKWLGRQRSPWEMESP